MHRHSEISEYEPKNVTNGLIAREVLAERLEQKSVKG